jgi:hypothetical protein
LPAQAQVAAWARERSCAREAGSGPCFVGPRANRVGFGPKFVSNFFRSIYSCILMNFDSILMQISEQKIYPTILFVQTNSKVILVLLENIIMRIL